MYALLGLLNSLGRPPYLTNKVLRLVDLDAAVGAWGRPPT